MIGVVKDKETGKPLAGVRIASDQTAEFPVHGFNGIETTTDDQGRYRLIGLPKGRGNHVVVMPAKGQPYLAAGIEVPDTPGLDPVPLDVGLKRGIVIEGRVTDQKSGKPLKAFVEYNAYSDNPHIADAPGFDRSDFWGRNTTEADGSLSRGRPSRSRTDRRHVYRRRHEILDGQRLRRSLDRQSITCRSFLTECWDISIHCPRSTQPWTLGLFTVIWHSNRASRGPSGSSIPRDGLWRVHASSFSRASPI